MNNNDTAHTLFKPIDTNRDEHIEKNEFHAWISNNEELPSSSYEAATSRLNRYDDTTTRFDRYKYQDSFQDDLGYTADKYTSYGTRKWMHEPVINTNSSEETNYYLERLGANIYKDSSPKIIRRARSESPVKQEQRVFVRYLQPPPVPPPGPLIIKEVRPRQPSPPLSLVIHEHAPSPPSPPPLILRERPPTPPKYIPSETIIRTLPVLPAPPRSVVIERFSLPPDNPRDIVIERRILYGPQFESRTIVEHAPSTLQYRVSIRKYQQVRVTNEDPDGYRTRDGSSLLDPATSIRQTRNTGVMRDISPPPRSSSLYTTTRGYSIHFDRSNDIINRDYSSTVRINSGGYQ
ncbi:unnamed protein product [Rotaria sordida]|uniref:EF-hand domain-containing protein n=1 Tax=Rotaria sordida TaxID=392033 RepID=A0A814HI15_9BILA|nr:unnamed protein product [Rotaria sordida]